MATLFVVSPSDPLREHGAKALADRVRGGVRRLMDQPVSTWTELASGTGPGHALAFPLLVLEAVIGYAVVAFREPPAEHDREYVLALAALASQALDRAGRLERETILREQAESANRSKDEFLATVGHELRNPLNAILGWAQMLKSGRLASAERERAIGIIERNAIAQAKLVDDLLDVSRIVAGRLRLEMDWVSPRTLVEAVVDGVAPAAEEKRVRFEVIERGAASDLLVDPDRLRQIIANLLSNALKFTPEQSTVRVGVVHSETHVEIAVTDGGEGIAKDDLARIFERFTQADGTFTRRHGGLGLGLTIARRLVELHEGTITAESEGLGFGATFRVRLPRRAERIAAAPRHLLRPEHVSGQAELPSLTGIDVLVVDDEPDARALLVSILEAQGAIVRSASGADEALEFVRVRRPSVILSDIGMPERDGYDLLRSVRALDADSVAPIPAAALTAYASWNDRRRAFDSGFRMHLKKPVSSTEVIQAVAALAQMERVQVSGRVSEETD